MLLTTIAAIRRRLPGAAIFARIPRVDYPAARMEQIRPLSIGEKGLLRKLVSKVKTASLIADGTCLIDISGFQFGDAWAARIAERRAATVRRFSAAGNAVFFMPQAWGPFESNLQGAAATRSLLQNSTLSFVRDKQSEEAVMQLAPTAPVRFAHDLAWNFEAGDPELAAQRLRDAGLVPGRHALTVCITPNQRVYERLEGQGADNPHIKLLVTMIRRLVGTYDAQVVLVGHELRYPNSPVKDDRYLCDLVKQCLDPSMPVVHLTEQYRAADLKAIVGQCQLVISSRYHALIAAMSQGIAVGTAGWSHKYTELLEETGGGLSFSHGDDTDATLARLDDLVQNRARYVAQLQSRLPEIKESSRETLDMVLDLVTRERSLTA